MHRVKCLFRVLVCLEIKVGLDHMVHDFVNQDSVAGKSRRRGKFARAKSDSAQLRYIGLAPHQSSRVGSESRRIAHHDHLTVGAEANMDSALGCYPNTQGYCRILWSWLGWLALGKGFLAMSTRRSHALPVAGVPRSELLQISLTERLGPCRGCCLSFAIFDPRSP